MKYHSQLFIGLLTVFSFTFAPSADFNLPQHESQIKISSLNFKSVQRTIPVSKKLSQSFQCINNINSLLVQNEDPLVLAFHSHIDDAGDLVFGNAKYLNARIGLFKITAHYLFKNHPRKIKPKSIIFEYARYDSISGEIKAHSQHGMIGQHKITEDNCDARKIIQAELDRLINLLQEAEDLKSTTEESLETTTAH